MRLNPWCWVADARRKYGHGFSLSLSLSLSPSLSRVCPSWHGVVLLAAARQSLVNTPTLVDTQRRPLVREPAATTRLWNKVENPFHLDWLPGKRNDTCYGKLLNSCQPPPLFSSTDRYHFIARVCKSSTPLGHFLLSLRPSGYTRTRWSFLISLFGRFIAARLFSGSL